MKHCKDLLKEPNPDSFFSITGIVSVCLVSPCFVSVSSRPVSYPENHYSLSPAGGDRVLPYRNPSASFSSPSSGLVALATMGPPGITPGPFVRYKPSPDRCVSDPPSQLNTSNVIKSVEPVSAGVGSDLLYELKAVCEHTVSSGRDLCGWLFLTAWRLITSRPTRKMCFTQLAATQKLKYCCSGSVFQALPFHLLFDLVHPCIFHISLAS